MKNKTTTTAPRGRYAAGSTIRPGERLERMGVMAEKYGAIEFSFGANRHRAAITFAFQGRVIRMVLGGLDQLSDRAVRQRFAAFELALKARLESVVLGIEAVETAFLAHLALDNGTTVGEWARAELDGVDRQPTPSAAPTPRPRLLRSAEPSTPTVTLTLAAPAAPPRAPVHLPVVEIGEITRPEDLFSCRPLTAKVTANRCVIFQDDAVRPYDHRRAGRVKQHVCEDCADGRAVKAALAAALVATPTPSMEIPS